MGLKVLQKTMETGYLRHSLTREDKGFERISLSLPQIKNSGLWWGRHKTFIYNYGSLV